MSPAGNISHVSNSVNQSSPIDHLQHQNTTLLTANTDLQSQIARLNDALAAAKTESSTRHRTIQSLQTESSNLKTHITNLETSLGELQNRYESKHRQYFDLHLARQNLIAENEKAARRIETQATDLAVLRTTKKALEQEIETARKDLLSSDKPDMARLAAAENETRAAKAEVAKLLTKTTTLKNEAELMRQAYQTASTSATDSIATIADLTAANEVLTRKASGEAARLAELNQDTAVQESRKEIRQLKHAVEEREKVVRRKEDEIAEL
ncbi:MAG: hypothetical protein Q9183_001735 [Haloplaca sp. 2 TL-2023]